MYNKIIKSITETPENMEVAYRIVESFDGAKQNILQNFWDTLCRTLKGKGLSIEQRNVDLIKKYYKSGNDDKIIRLWVVLSEINKNGKKLYLCWGAEIEHNFYTGFRICDENDNKSIINDDFAEYKKIVKGMNYEDSDSPKWLGWKYSRWELDFKKFNSHDVFSLSDQNKLETVVGEIVQEALTEIEAVKRQIS
jgi:hypothetical protein